MGNSGRSSTGCITCRKRKIKCDEGRPGCRKCAQIQKPCPGYPFSVEFHVRTEAVPQVQIQQRESIISLDHELLERPLAVRPTCTPPPAYTVRAEVVHTHTPREQQILEVKDESQDKSLLSLPRYRTKLISPPPRYDVQHQSTCFFLNLFSFRASKLYGIPIFDFLPDMLSKSSERSPLSQASKAVSRMTLADRYSGCDTRLQTSDEYAKALEAMRVTMSSVDEAVKDESVTAVWLLGLYEAVNSVLSHGRNTGARDLDAEWHSHIQHMRGAMRLLRLRGSTQFTNPRSEKIFRIFKAAIQMRLFILNSVTSADFDYLQVDIYKDEHEFVPSETAQKASAFFMKTARHLETAKYALHKLELQPESRHLASEIDQLLCEGECFDASMLRWSKVEPGWDMMAVTGNVKNTMWVLYPFHARYYFYNFWIFLYWIRFLIARIKLYETLIELIKVKKRNSIAQDVPRHKLTHFDTKIDSFSIIIQKTADDLIGMTAYALGDVTNTGAFYSAPSACNPGGGWNEVNVVAAMQLVIPFKVLLRSEYTTPLQKGAIDLAITHIADGFRRQPIVPEFTA